MLFPRAAGRLPMSRFVHVLMTRFNVSLPGRVLADRAWLAHRFELFEQFCFPSVAAQSCQNFTWLVFFKSGLDEESQKRIESYRHYSSFVPLYVEDALDAHTLIRAVDEPARGYDFLITSRLDNDDALATRYVETVQSCFARSEFQFLNFTDGYQISRKGVYRYRDTSNPFISLIERVPGFRTVLGCGNHSFLAKAGPIRQLEAVPGWLQVIHGRNLLNRIAGTPVSGEELAADFSIYPGCLRYFRIAS